MPTRKQIYRIRHKEWIVEGRASSPQNACRLAFRKLIAAGLIEKQPISEADGTFAETSVELLKEGEEKRD